MQRTWEIRSLEPTPGDSQLPETPGPGNLGLLQASMSYKDPDGSTASHLAKSGVQPRFHGSNKFEGMLLVSQVHYENQSFEVF